jgi:hypothetical protein
MDLERFDSVSRADEGVEMELLDPVTRKKTGAALILHGMDSRIYKTAMKEGVAKLRALGREVASEEGEAMDKELVARCTKGWRGLAEGGEELRFSEEEARKLYEKYPELYERARDFIRSRANFFGSASGD